MSFIARFREIHGDILREGIDAHDMRDDGHLERVFIGAPGSDGEDVPGAGRIEWLESEPARPRVIAPVQASSQIRYFLDGAQRTLRAFYADNIPVIAGIVGAAVLRRDESGGLSVVEGMAEFRRVWVAPVVSDRTEINKIVTVLLRRGERVLDPLQKFEKEAEYERELGDFSGLVEHAFKCVGNERAELEHALLLKWRDRPTQDDGLLLVDGPLRAPVVGAVGLVKSFTRQYLSGAEAATLFRLRQTERTAAFRVTDAWRPDTPIRAWYQRHWSAAGRDPRHALIRLELSDAWTDHPAYDEIATWVIEERVPTAKTDARWATLLYPVHHLEEILKRQIEAQTRGWSARG